MVNVRELPPDEWHKLANHPSITGQPVPNATDARAVVAERDGEIVGVWWIQLAIHMEPVWIAESERGSLTGLRMFTAVSEILDTHQITGAYCLADRPEVADYLDRLGLTALNAVPFILCRPSSPSASPSPTLGLGTT